MSKQHLKTVENLPNEEVCRFEQSEVKNFTKSLTNFRNQCEKKGLSVREFEEESVGVITDRYKRFFFKSKWAQSLYKFNNAVGTTNRFLLETELSKSVLPIAYFTSVTCKMWAYVTSSIFPTVSKALHGISSVAMSPIWLAEFMINKALGPIFRATPLKAEIPLNITGEVAAGTGLTWEKLPHTYEFV